MTSPDGKIRIPINEDAGETGQIEEYLQEYKGEGIQHVALRLAATSTHRSRRCVGRRRRVHARAANEIYYSRIDERLPKHGEPIGAPEGGRHPHRRRGRGRGGFTKVLLQRFGKTAIGPIFFEFIQRKGDDGFGEGNFKALFESIEEDQIRRGVLKTEVA